jgi:predicted ATPase
VNKELMREGCFKLDQVPKSIRFRSRILQLKIHYKVVMVQGKNGVGKSLIGN